MQTRLFSLGLGIVYVVIGIVAFIPAFYSNPPASAPHLDITASYGYFLGNFPVNAVLNAGHMAIGLAGIAASARLTSARYYCMGMFLACGLLAFWGFIPTLDTLSGAAPILGDDTWWHAGTAIAAGYFGFVVPEPSSIEPLPARTH